MIDIENLLGLRSFRKRVKGASFRYKVKELYWQIRYAWQRAWRGYDYTDVFELGFNFVERMPTLLRDFKENNVALFPDFDNPERVSLTEEETNEVLDEMIFYFENCDEDVVYERLFGVSPYDEKERYNHERWVDASKERKRCWNEAMRLFAKWSSALWY